MTTKPIVTDVMEHIEIDVRWGDMDALAHVNNAVFFTYFEQLRGIWLTRVFPSWTEADEGPILAATSCSFRQPLSYPARIEVQLRCAEPGKSSLLTVYEISDTVTGDVYASGDGAVVWIDKTTGRPIPLPAALLADVDAHRLDRPG